ncbi:MAG: ABC transporter permease [Candidatus Magasanikbacteria bacterium]|nr:ABC transporter permease [Candidatus Magasanikbacteria bacterium]
MFTHMWALYAREVKRFQKIWIDTVFSPIVSVGLYLGVFGVVAAGRDVGSISYISFVYAGLLAMMVVNSSFSNPSFALVIAKNVGNIVDLQLVPIAPWRIGISYALAAFTRSIATLCIAVAATIWFIPGPYLSHPLFLLLGLFLTGLEFGMLGVIFGFLAQNFEALTFMTTFVMQPMIFLSGVFYPISTLPGIWSHLSLFNPIHHNVNLLRYGMTGYSDFSPSWSLLIVFLLTSIFFVVMQVTARRSLRMK